MKTCCKPLIFSAKTSLYLILSTFKCWKASLLTLYSFGAISFCVSILIYYHFQDVIIAILNTIFDYDVGEYLFVLDKPMFYATAALFLAAHFNYQTINLTPNDFTMLRYAFLQMRGLAHPLDVVREIERIPGVVLSIGTIKRIQGDPNDL
jgi:hypothetical protein